jgi:galactonate dehydratase
MVSAAGKMPPHDVTVADPDMAADDTAAATVTCADVLRIERVLADLVDFGRANVLFVRIETSDGITGVGETLLKRHDLTIRQSVIEVGETLVGRDPRAIEDIGEKLYRDSFWVGGPLHAAARSAIDIALWDVKGQHYGLPVYELLGGRSRDELALYCHCPCGATPEEFAARLARVRADGYSAAKTTLPLFYGSAAPPGSVDYSGVRGSIDGSLKETEHVPTATFDRIAEFFDAARGAVGWEFELMVDCHGRLSAANAIRLADALQPFRLLFIEEPIPPESAEELARVRARARVPIAAGERLATIYEVRPFLALGAVDFLQCDPVACGGITGAKKIAAMAEAHYVPFAPHNPNGPVATFACAHVLTAIPNASLLETVGSAEDARRNAELVDPPPAVADGKLTLGDAPGLGTRMREGAAERFPPGRYTALR